MHARWRFQYRHDGRRLTLVDTMEFLNPMTRVTLSEQEKKDLVACVLAL